MPMFDKPFLLFPIHQPMFRHLFELRSRTTVIGIRIDRDASTRSKDSRDFDIFGVHQFNKVFHDDIYTIFMKSSMIAEAEKVEFQTFAFYHFYFRNVADTYFGKVRLSGNGTQTCELRAVETYPIVIFQMLIIKSFQYFRSIILLILGLSSLLGRKTEYKQDYTRSFFPIRKVGLLIQSLLLLNYNLYLDKKMHFLFHLSPDRPKHLINRHLSGDRFIFQPITVSITYHLQLLTNGYCIRSPRVSECFLA